MKDKWSKQHAKCCVDSAQTTKAHVPLTKRIAGACARVKWWSAPDEKGRRSSIQVDTAISPIVEALFERLFLNHGRLNEEFIGTLVTELRRLRLEHEGHHP